MHDLHWPLTVLSKAIHYKNITAASTSIGLSQPQISRLIQKLETQLEVRLIDKSSPRNSSWTPQARQLATLFDRSSKTLESAIEQLKEDSRPSIVKIASLEGLALQACKLAKELMESSSVKECYIDVFDQDEMEAKFISGEIDLMFSSRLPGKKKTLPHKIIGYQKLIKSQSEGPYRLFSPFEYSSLTAKKKSGLKGSVIISNSLFIRDHWLNTIGGTGQLPGPLQKKETSSSLPVLLIAQDFIHPEIWEKCL